MKKLFGILMLGAMAVSLVGSAQARPPYPAIFKEVYEGNGAAIKDAITGDKKCNVCHEGTDKKMRNEFGKALSKHFGKDDFTKLKGDKEALAAGLKEAFKKVEKDKNSDGKTFGELLKDGKLPGGALK
jgi:hypothetical protein